MPDSMDGVVAAGAPLGAGRRARPAHQARPLLERRVRAAAALAGASAEPLHAGPRRPATTPPGGSGCRGATSSARRWRRPPPCWRSAPARVTTQPSAGTFDLPPESTTEPEVATSILGGDGQPVLDVQQHLLELDGYDGTFGSSFPQAGCGDGRRLLRHGALARPRVRALRHHDGGALGHPGARRPRPALGRGDGRGPARRRRAVR